MQTDERPEFELVVQPSARISNRIARAGKLFSYLRFSKAGIPPGTTERILSDPEKYWRKKVDGSRICYEPIGPLRIIHDRIAGFLKNHWGIHLENFPATAFWVGSSTIQNGLYHRHNASSLCLDARKAFESIKAKHICRYLLRTGEMLYGPHDRYWNDRAQAWIVSRLLTYRGRLRQGSPSSPFVFNLLYRRLDKAMQEALVAFPDVVYTRYADDFCFSASATIFPLHIERIIRNVLREYHVVINEKKTRRGARGILEFPGIVIVHGRIRPSGAYVAKLALWGHRALFDSGEWEGHRNFVTQFGRSGTPRTLKELLYYVPE